MSLGLSMAGLGSKSAGRIETVAAADIWTPACATFESNLGIKPYNSGVDKRLIRRILSSVGKVDLVVGGPPCQGFSTSGKRALDDERNHLVKAFLQAVELAEPSAFILENVVGFTSFQNGKILEEVIERGRKLGFTVHPGVVLASRFGVPQRRRRFILIGERTGNFEFPNTLPKRDTPTSGLLEVDQRADDEFRVVSFDEATNDLPVLESGEQANIYKIVGREMLSKYQQWSRKGSPALDLHVASRHGSEFVRMMSYVPQGRSALDPDVKMPRELRPTSGFPNSYARIRGNEPAPTITRNFTTPSSANCIHPYQNRALSLREGARCQSFPDSFKFLGTHSEIRLQIGNAVPPLLSKGLGEALLRSLSN